MNFTEKHVFLISDCDIFFHLYADALVQKCDINSDQIIVIVYKSGGKPSIVKNQNFNYVEYEKKIAKELSSANTITSISLISKTAEIVKEICYQCSDFWHKYHVFITDDEVDRWKNNLHKKDGLLINENQEISKNVIFVLSNVLNFIVTEKYFKIILENILKRKNFNIVNASFVFDILPIIQSESIKNVLDTINYQKSNRILLGSKGFSLKGVFSFLMTNYSSLKNMQIVFFPISLNRRIIIDIFLFFLRTIYRTPIDFIYLGKLNALTYNVMISSCSYFVLQDRGGASSARLYVKWGCGRLLIRKGSANERYFSEVYNINCLDWESKSLRFLNDEIENKIILENSLKVKEEEKRSIQVLNKLYANAN